MSTSSTKSSTYSSQKRSLRWTSSKRKIMAVIKVDHLEDTNIERLSWAMPLSGLKAKNENDPKEEDNLRWKMTFDGRRPLMEDDLLRKTTIDGRRPLAEEDLWQKTTFDGRRPFIEDDLQWKTTMRTTSKTKRTCTLMESKLCWTYFALRSVPMFHYQCKNKSNPK